MSRDPYHDVQRDIENSLQVAASLNASYLRIKSTARGETEELQNAFQEASAQTETIDVDLDDLEESVCMVESTGARMFHLDDREVLKRRDYVERTRKKLRAMQAELETANKVPFSSSSTAPIYTSASPREDDRDNWSRQEQQMLVQQQDVTLTNIGGTLTTLAEQGRLMGREIGEHTEMLQDLERGVDSTDAKLESAMKRMQRFIRETEETKSGWCIGILIVILCALLLAVVLI